VAALTVWIAPATRLVPKTACPGATFALRDRT
jgi:hypothetical protein